MTERNESDVRVPWFSGLCLEGEVAGQYAIECLGSHQELEDSTEAGLLELDGLAPITIFVGANNSGKSRLLRELFKVQYPMRFKLNAGLGNGPESDIGKRLQSWKSDILNEIPQTTNSQSSSWMKESELKKINGMLASTQEGLLSQRYAAKRSRLRQLERVQKELADNGIKDGIRGFAQVKRCYIPILRGMRPPLSAPLTEAGHASRNDLYEQRTIHDYFADIAGWPSMRDRKMPRSSIFTGLSLYDNLRRRLLGRTQSERDTVRNYEDFLSRHFFPGQPVILVPAEYSKGDSSNDVVHIKIGNKDDRPIYELGDGMQSLIICTYPIVTETEKGSLFFLEEPDLCMHPSLQRTFIEVLKTYHREMGHQFFITTHSNHLLDILEASELVSIFSFSEIAAGSPAPAESTQPDNADNSQALKPKPSFRIRPSNLKDRRTLLELGVRPSATYLANATIWVEGVSDCAYLRAHMEAFVHYLKIRGKQWGASLAQRLQQYKEDRHYAFVEYSGSNLEHFSFDSEESDDGQAEAGSGKKISAPDLCATAIVIADRDIRDKGDRSIRLEEKLRERFICLPGKEIENLIPEALMKQQVEDDHAGRRHGVVEPEAIELIAYDGYCRSDKGIGAYLGRERGIEKYKPKSGNGNDPGTLPSHYKTRWRSEVEGIPALLRMAIHAESRQRKPEHSDAAKGPVISGERFQYSELPGYINQDLIWLCVLLYAHIASCNHDTDARDALMAFKAFIKRQGSAQVQEQACLSPTETPDEIQENPQKSGQGHEAMADPWPIPDPNQSKTSRACLLTEFLSQWSQSEPHPQITPATLAPMAHPAS